MISSKFGKKKIFWLRPQFVVYSPRADTAAKPSSKNMNRAETATLPQKTRESLSYMNLFTDSLPEIRRLLDVMFSSLFKSWGAFAIVAYKGESDCGTFVNFADLGPLCAFIDEIGRRDSLVDLVERRALEVGRDGDPVSYWCDWGLLEIAIPIVIHGIPVGVILCGQKRLEGEEDLEGQRKLEKFAVAKGLEAILPELLDRRNLCSAVTRLEVSEKVQILWGASQFISEVLFKELDTQNQSDRAVAEELEDLFEQFAELDGKNTPSARFWKNLEQPLDKLASTFDCRCITVVLEADGKHQLVAAQGLRTDDLQLPLDTKLISTHVRDFELPQHLLVNFEPLPACFVTASVKALFPSVETVLLDKARLGANRVLHLLVYFEPGITRENQLLLHQKEKALSLFLRHTANSLLHAERVEQLEQALSDQDALLQDIVHQINQPLHGILADSELLLNTEYPVERKTRLLKYFPQRAKQLAMLVKCVQYAERDGPLQTAKPDPSSVNLSKFLIESAMVFQGYAEDKDVRIEVDTKISDGLDEIQIDRDHVSMALTNVLFNAVKYAFRGTIVTIRSDVENMRLAILVTNDGIQIKPSEREEIFSRRLRTDLAKRFAQSGLGIGLYVTRAIMRNMGGEASVIDSIPTSRAYKQFRECRTTISLSLPTSIVSNQGGPK